MTNTFGILQAGPAGFVMNTAFYLPFGGAGETLISSTTSQVVVRINSTGETYAFGGAFNGAATVQSILGTINSIVADNASNQLEWQITSTNLAFGPAGTAGSYLSFANAQNYFGFEFAAIGTSGEMFGGAGNDGFVAFAGNHTIDGGGGINQADYRSEDIYATELVVNTSTGTVTGPFGTDQVSNVQTFFGSNTNHGFFGANVFVNGPGSHTFVGFVASQISNQLYAGGFNQQLQGQIAPTGPVIVDFSFDTAANGFFATMLNGYGGTDAFNNNAFSDGNGFLQAGGTSTGIIAGPGDHSVRVASSSLTLDYSHSAGGVHVSPVFGVIVQLPIPPPVGYSIVNGFGGTDGIGFHTLATSNLLDFHPGRVPGPIPSISSARHKADRG